MGVRVAHSLTEAVVALKEKVFRLRVLSLVITAKLKPIPIPAVLTIEFSIASEDILVLFRFHHSLKERQLIKPD